MAMFATVEPNHNANETTEEICLPVFTENPLAITEQPVQRHLESSFPGNRRAISIITIDQQISQTSNFVPFNGIDLLRESNQLIIQQTVELNDLMSALPSENRYVVKVPRGDTIYYAIETSKNFERTCFGSSRSFFLRLYDPSQQQSLEFKRRLACGVCCSAFCYLQELEVWIPPGELVGTIKQTFSVTKPTFLVINRHQNILYRIEGNSSLLGCFYGQNHNFQIYNADGATQVGSFVHQWDQVQVDYNMHVQFPGNIQDPRDKSLLLGAAFLLEYMYFENSKKKSCKC